MAENKLTVPEMKAMMLPVFQKAMEEMFQDFKVWLLPAAGGEKQLLRPQVALGGPSVVVPLYHQGELIGHVGPLEMQALGNGESLHMLTGRIKAHEDTKKRILRFRRISPLLLELFSGIMQLEKNPPPRPTPPKAPLSSARRGGIGPTGRRRR